MPNDCATQASLMILTVFLSNNEQILTEVPITPETTCRDVVEFCKEPGEGSCHLAEVWRGNERPIPFDHMMYEHLQKWGPRREEVKFFLRHEDSPTESNEQGGRQTQEQRTQRNVMSAPAEKRTENGVGNPRVELTLSELQDMAARQQQQIENQQQMLVAKEQRLHFLKHQERRQQQSISENEKLQKLKERVEAQENKLKKIRAMRGQVDYSKIMNGNLSAEIERFSAMFQEKKQEVQTAILRVDQLSQQLEDLKRGKLSGLQSYSGKLAGPAAAELKRLCQELQIRNQLNQEQTSKLQQQKELLNKRNMEVAVMDKRISELRERLYGKKIQLSRVNGTSSPQSPLSTPGRVAAVGPYTQVPSAGSYSVPGDPVKPQSLTVASSAAHGRSKSANDGNWPTLKQNSSSSVKPTQIAGVDWKDSSMEGPLKQGTVSSQPTPLSALGTAEKLGTDMGKMPPPVPGVGKQLPPSYGTYPSPAPMGPGSTNSLERRKEGSLPRPSTGLPGRQKPGPVPPAGTPGSSQQIQQRISVPPSPTYPPVGPPAFPAGDSKPELPVTVAIRPFLADKGSRPQSPRKGPQTVNSSSIYSMYLQQATPPKNYQPAVHSTLNKSVKAVYGKPVLPSGSTSPSPLPFLHGSLAGSTPQAQPPPESAEKEPEQDSPAPPGDGGTGSGTVESLPRPLSPTKLTPIVHSPLRYQSDADLEALRRKLANAPRPLKKRSSITEPEGPGGPNIQKLLYQRFNTLAGGMEGTPFYQPGPSQDFMGTLADVDNGNTTNGNLGEASPARPTAPLPTEPAPSSDANDNELPSPEPEGLICPQSTHQTAEPAEDDNNNVATAPPTEQVPSPGAEAPSPGEDQAPPPLPSTVPAPGASTSKRTNLKKPNSERTGHGLRVRFNPLALLLDASLEGEFDLVQRIIYEVEDPSKPNDEGITPLHNAVCAGHHHIVKFLLDFGVNVNAADSDGWTPLHCAASCNSVHLCKQLVESGAAIFASTISDIETAADKCEEMEEGYIQCSQFLYGVQEKLGVMNKGVVYALWGYEAQNSDELSFHEGDALTILRRKDESETEWWWARLGDREGYVPKNLLGLYPRIKPRQRTLA
ncbi:apoptosis-stimulating of p53 protein 1 isoform X3 [Ursus arctos]|uniref:apoptosis-stimulating of p53 protein 1 isoform X3 n=1 Tax=Ursus arctos TaxID=9644 RepID=UPI002547B2AF|nr:apoptosis-stimulating of p53 protein 1 isoform X3 [Ursus arctos]